MFGIFRLFTIALYFAPSIAAFLRRKKAPTLAAGNKVFVLVFLVNFLLGWTLIGWLVAWWLAYSETIAARMAMSVVTPAGGGAPALPVWEAQQSQPRTCGACGGSGRERCPSCQGRGSWYDPPRGANDVPQLSRCTYCTSAGTVQCTSCGGSGHSAY